ncbi:MAG: hypothetical protein WAU58_12110 [Terriglobales bacterium]
MKRYIGLAMVIALGAALSLPSCGHDQKLVSIAVTPTSVIYPSPSSGPADFGATGTYIHPPETKDITAQVTWSTDVTELLSFAYLAGTGETVAPNNGNCGIASVWASAPEGTGGSSNIVISPPSSVTVNNTANPLCPGGSGATSGTLVLTPAGTGTGTVISSPAGISCPGTQCGAIFTSPDNFVTLTASNGANSTFAQWQGCSVSQSNPNQCTVTVPEGGLVNVLAFFSLN